MGNDAVEFDCAACYSHLMVRETQSVHGRVHCAIAQWFEVCLVLCCRFELLPAELPW